MIRKGKQFGLIKYLIAFVFFLTLYSCAEYKIIGIQTLKPADLNIPKDFSQPMVVASIYRGIESLEESMARAALDSTAAMEAALVLSESLYDSPWFQGFEIPVKIHYREDTSHLILPFSWPEVENITREVNADLLISLEYIKITPTVDGYSFWNGAYTAYYGSLTMNIYAYWRVYDLNRKTIKGEYLFKDTLIWDETDHVRVRVGNQLPGLFSASTYCGYIAGREYAKKIAPSWMDEQRFYFTRGSREMRKAAPLAENNQWLDAAKFWQDVLNKQNVKPELAAKAAFNMAVANEMAGNFEVAIQWLNKSRDLYRIPEEPWYRRILDFRIQLLEQF